MTREKQNQVKIKPRTKTLEVVSKFDSASNEALTSAGPSGLEFSYETFRPAVGGDGEFIAEAARETPRGASGSGQSCLRGRHSLGVANRCSLARSARRVSQSLHLLEAVANLGRTGRVAARLARAAGHVGPARSAAMGRNVFRCDLLPR